MTSAWIQGALLLRWFRSTFGVARVKCQLHALITVFTTRRTHPSFWMGLNWNPWRVALISGGAYRLQRVLWEGKEPASAREGSLPHDSEHWDSTGSYRGGGKLGGIVFVSNYVSFFVFVSHCVSVLDTLITPSGHVKVGVTLFWSVKAGLHWRLCLTERPPHDDPE